MTTIGGDVTEEIISEVDLFGSIIQQNVIKNEFNREYAQLAIIQTYIAIGFTIMNSNDLYCNLNNSRMHMLDTIIKIDRTNIDANTAGKINLTLHLIIREIG